MQPPFSGGPLPFLFVSRALFIFLSHLGSGSLLDPVRAVESKLSSAENENLGWVPFTLCMVVLFSNFVIRYVLGRVFPALLILEAAQGDNTRSANNISPSTTEDSSTTATGVVLLKPRPIFRNVSSAIRLLYRNKGIWMLLRGIKFLAIYSLVLNILVSCFYLPVFFYFPEWSSLYLASAISSGLLYRFHLRWTCSIISAPTTTTITTKSTGVVSSSSSFGATSRSPDERNGMWKRLAVLNAIQWAIRVLLCQAAEGLEDLLLSSSFLNSESDLISQSPRLQENPNWLIGIKFIMLFALICCLLIFVQLPVSIILTMTEASVLPENLETVIPSHTMRRGMTIAELLGESGDFKKNDDGDDNVNNTDVSFTPLTRFLGPLFDHRIWWLFELHLKKCSLQLLIELLFWPIMFIALRNGD